MTRLAGAVAVAAAWVLSRVVGVWWDDVCHVDDQRDEGWETS